MICTTHGSPLSPIEVVGFRSMVNNIEADPDALAKANAAIDFAAEFALRFREAYFIASDGRRIPVDLS